jgi:hypothetical protein
VDVFPIEANTGAQQTLKPASGGYSLPGIDVNTALLRQGSQLFSGLDNPGERSQPFPGLDNLGQRSQTFSGLDNPGQGFPPFDSGLADPAGKRRRTESEDRETMRAEEASSLQATFSDTLAKELEEGPGGAMLREWSERVASRVSSNPPVSHSLSVAGLGAESLADFGGGEAFPDAWAHRVNAVNPALNPVDHETGAFEKEQIAAWSAGFVSSANQDPPNAPLSRGLGDRRLDGEPSAQLGERVTSPFGSVVPNELIELNDPPQDSQVSWTPENSIIEGGLDGLESEPPFGNGGLENQVQDTSKGTN